MKSDAGLRIAFHVPRASFLGPEVVGESVRLNNLLRALEERGHEVQIVSRVNVRDFWRGRLPARSLIAEALSTWKAMKRFSPDAWLVYGPSVTYPDLLGWWQRPKRYVLMGVDPYTSRKMPRWWRWLFSLADRRSLARADVVCAHRPRCLQRLRASGIEEHRLRLLLPFAKVWHGMPSKGDARHRLGLPEDGPVILCVSRLAEGKERRKTDAILQLLETFATLPRNCTLVLVGDGPGRGRVEDKAAELNLEGRIRPVGFVKDIKAYYAACDLFAYPLGLDRPWVAVLEAQACGRPVVVMRTTSAEVTVEDGETGLLAKDPEEFGAHLAALSSDRERCESMGKAASVYIRRAHSLDLQVGELEKLLIGEA